MKTRLKPLSLLFVVPTLLGGCAVSGESSPDPSELGVESTDDAEVLDLEQFEIAKVEVSPDVTITWYEPIPGVILRGGKARAGAEVQDVMNLPSDPIGAFEQLAPTREVPIALRAAAAREQEMRSLAKEAGVDVPVEVLSTETVSGSAEPRPEVTTKTQAISDATCPWDWFRGTICTLCAGVDCGFVESHPNRTTTDQIQKDDVWIARPAVCPFSGNPSWQVWLRPWFSWESKFALTITAGHAWWWDWSAGGGPDADAKSRVSTNANPSFGFHHCMAYNH